MNVDPKTFLRLVEDTKRLVTWDIEATGFKADYDSVLCASLKPYGKKPYSFRIKALGNDVRVVRSLKEALEEYDCWLTYYGKGFDVPFVNTRLLKWGYEPIQPRHHVDLYFTLKANTAVSSRGMGSLARFLGKTTGEQKMDVSQNVWSEIGFKMHKHMPVMVRRCESDCEVLEGLYDKTKHMIKEIKRGAI